MDPLCVEGGGNRGEERICREAYKRTIWSDHLQTTSHPRHTLAQSVMLDNQLCFFLRAGHLRDALPSMLRARQTTLFASLTVIVRRGEGEREGVIGIVEGQAYISIARYLHMGDASSLGRRASGTDKRS